MTPQELYVASVQSELVTGCDLENHQIAQICFTFEDIQIHDPLHGDNGMYSVDAEYYGLTESQRSDLIAVNEAIAKHIVNSIDEMAQSIHQPLHITQGDMAAQVYQGDALAQYILATSTLMCNHALEELTQKWDSAK